MLENSLRERFGPRRGYSLSLEFIVSPTSVDGKLRSVRHWETGIEILKFAFVL